VNWAQTGLNRLALSLLCLDAIVLIVEISLYFRLGLTVEWTPDAAVAAGMLVLLLGLWLYYHFVPGTAIESFIAEVILVLVMTIVFVNIIVLAQYPAVALKAPYADPWLAAADARLGVNVPALARWTTRHPAISQVLRLVYFTHVPQFALAVFGLGALRDRDALWEFAFHFQVCLTIAVAALVFWPAVHAPAYYNVKSTIDMAHLIAQIKGLHEGTMTVVKIRELEGLVSFPSFHVAGGLIVTWVFRRHPGFLVPLIVLNSAMVAATVMTGVHYVIDVIASVPMVMASIALFARWGRGLIWPPGSR
jgi:hypothetical protein